jgi:hypothetical protein
MNREMEKNHIEKILFSLLLLLFLLGWTWLQVVRVYISCVMVCVYKLLFAMCVWYSGAIASGGESRGGGGVMHRSTKYGYYSNIHFNKFYFFIKQTSSLLLFFISFISLCIQTTSGGWLFDSPSNIQLYNTRH